jgi:conjugative relaxase-like TrwC/TraI family protein
MFTMAKIRDGSTYLSHHLAANDYYCENETIDGRWTGHGSEKLGLHGVILARDQAFENLRNNRFPGTGEKLTPRDCEDRVRFFDFQCSAQKSISIMAVTIGDTRLIEAHDQAAAKAFAELERFAATQANTALDRNNRTTGNVVAAAFRHTASRALDPQVHTHHVTANATWDEASKSWRAVTEFEMLRAIRYAGKVYQNEIARSCLSLGYEIAETRDAKGRVTGFEIAGVTSEIRERFSKRRAEVEEGVEAFRQKHGRDPTPAEIHTITVGTRAVKLHEVSSPQVLAAQRAQLSATELAQLTALREQAEARVRRGNDRPEVGRERESVRLAIGHLFERRSVAIGHEVLAEALNANLGHNDLSRLRGQAEKAGLVSLAEEPWVQAPFTTRRGLALEQWAVAFVEKTRGQFAELGKPDASALASLSAPQQKAVAELLTSRDQVVCLRGAAGVGKTTMIRAMHAALAEGEREVVFCAPTSSAADTLRKDGITMATTVSDFLQNGAVRDRSRLERAVFVVDEAGLSSNAQGAEILRLAERCNARVVFVGDSKQHTSVEAGDFLRVLEAHAQLQRIEVTDIRRQLVNEYRDAVKLMAVGASKSGLERMDALGWVKEGKAGYLQAAVEDFVERANQGKELGKVMAVTPTWAENHTFTDKLRSELKSRGVLTGGESVTALDTLQWTRAQKSRAENYSPGLAVRFNRSASGFRQGLNAHVTRVESGKVWIGTLNGERALPIKGGDFEVFRAKPLDVCVGDKILLRANDRRAGLINGEILTVRSIRNGVIETSEGRRIDTAKFGQLAYGYAVTSHKSQSKSVEHVVVAAERLDAKAAYVACSRGRMSCTVHTPDKANLLGHLPTGDRPAALDVLTAHRETPRTIADRRETWNESRQVGQQKEQPLAKAQRALAHPWWREAMGEIKEWLSRISSARAVDDGLQRKDPTHGR